jgi:hypothetical protein
MIPLSPLSGLDCVPYRHRVSAVGGLAPVKLNLNAPLNPYASAQSQDKARQNYASRGRYDAASAGPGFAAQILVEAGLAGSDPFAGARGAKAYDTRRAPITTLRLVA